MRLVGGQCYQGSGLYVLNHSHVTVGFPKPKALHLGLVLLSAAASAPAPLREGRRGVAADAAGSVAGTAEFPKHHDRLPPLGGVKDGRTDGWMDGRTDGWMDGWISGRCGGKK